MRQQTGKALLVQLRRNFAATIIQSAWRSFVAQKLLAKNIRRIVRIQCLWRVKKAKQEYRQLRAEARNVDKIKDLNKGLENKIMELKRKLDDKNAAFKAEKENLLKGRYVKISIIGNFFRDFSFVRLAGLYGTKRVLGP